MEQKNEEKNKKLIIIYFLILIFLIIITFLLIQCLGKIDNSIKVSTGNIDIFDIVLQGTPLIVVEDNTTVYSANTPLRIFTHTSYNIVNNVIAPMSENSYQFVIRNNNDFDLNYSFEAIEENKYNINMKYRLKLNGKYVLGNDNKYVTAKDLYQYDITLNSGNHDVYTLDWKWFESKNDTEIGTNINSNYKLNLKILASQVLK